jgi:hypothetical protein
VGEDRTPYERRLTVSEAADALGISAEAVRGRIRRGTLPVEREGGTVYVLLSDQAAARTTGDQPRTSADRTDLLIAELQDRVRSLEDANRENRRIIAALTSRIPAIEAPASPEPRESPESPSPTEAPTEAARGAQEPREASGMHMPEAGGGPLPHDQQTPSERPWWRRLFGG